MSRHESSAQTKVKGKVGNRFLQINLEVRDAEVRVIPGDIMIDRQSKQFICLIFVLMYVPFVYAYGYQLFSQGSIDFPSFYASSKVTFNDNKSPYSEEALTSVGIEIKQKVYPYLYPPPSLLAFYPLSLFTYEQGRTLLMVINHLCLAAFIYLFFFHILWTDASSTNHILSPAALSLAYLMPLVYVLNYKGIIVNFDHGQINLIVLVLMVVSWIAIKNNRAAWLIGLPLSLAVLLKTYPVVLVLFLVFRRKYQAVMWCTSLLCLYTVAAYLILPSVVWGDWMVNVLPTGGYGETPFHLFSPASQGNQNINGFAARLFTENEFSEPLLANKTLARITAYLLSFVVLITTLGLSVLRARQIEDGKSLDIEFSLYLLLMYLAAPLSWEHHLVYILPSILLGLHFVLMRAESWRAKLMVITSAFLIAWNLPLNWGGLRYGLLTLVISLKFYAVVTVWSFLAFKMWRHLEAYRAANNLRGQRLATPSIHNNQVAARPQ